MKHNLTETATLLKKATQEFAQAEITPHAAEIDASNTFPND